MRSTRRTSYAVPSTRAEVVPSRYAAGALCLVLGMAEPDAKEHSAFAMQQGFSCLGSWRRDECLQYCEQLSGRDVVVRAVPGVRGKQAWQGSPANTSPESLPASR